jgi:hypothetical protein
LLLNHASQSLWYKRHIGAVKRDGNSAAIAMTKAAMAPASAFPQNESVGQQRPDNFFRKSQSP